jgi:hypothetical protein
LVVKLVVSGSTTSAPQMKYTPNPTASTLSGGHHSLHQFSQSLPFYSSLSLRCCSNIISPFKLRSPICDLMQKVS